MVVTTEAQFNELLSGINTQTSRMLKNIGIRINLAEVSGYLEYMDLSEQLAEMHPVHRWLSFRLRREKERRKLRYMAALLNETLERGREAQG